MDAEFSIWHISTDLHTRYTLSSKRSEESQLVYLNITIFSIYINDLPTVITDVDVNLYANDTE